MSTCCQAEARQRGGALVIALLVVAIVTLFATTVSSNFLASFRQSEQLMKFQQAWSYLEFAEEVALYSLQRDLTEREEGNQSDYAGEKWAEPFRYTMMLSGTDVVIEGELVDLQGRLNLNQLVLPAPENQRFSVHQQRFIRLLQCFDDPVVSESEAIAITEAIIDWVDTNNQVTGQGGAEDLHYADQLISGRAGNRPMASPSELRWVKGMTHALYTAIEPHITVWPQQNSTLNINSASLEVLRSLNQDGNLSPLDTADVLTVIDERNEHGWTDLSIFENGVLAGRNINTDSLGMTSDYFMLDAQALLDTTTFKLSSVLNRGNERMRVVARSQGGW